MKRPAIVLVTDPAFGDDRIVWCIEQAARALHGGALCVQLRDKARARVCLRVFAGRLREVTRRVGASLVVNGDAEIARDVGAEGVHLGRGAGEVAQARAVFRRRAWVSVAAHSDEEVRRAVNEGADAVLLSPVFPSRPPGVSASSKRPRGIEALRSARAIARCRCAVYALGGIGPDNAAACRSAGADGVAVMKGPSREHRARA